MQFGGTGDLTKNKLLPAYNELIKKGFDFHLIALGRKYELKKEYINEMISENKNDYLKFLSYWRCPEF